MHGEQQDDDDRNAFDILHWFDHTQREGFFELVESSVSSK